jgi:hypothetical protein
LKKAGKKITSQYEEFDEILEAALNINQARNNNSDRRDSDTDVSDLDPFLDDEEERSKNSKSSSSSAATKSREEHVQDINDALNMDVDVPENNSARKID